MSSDASRSAMVRDNFSILVYARAGNGVSARGCRCTDAGYPQSTRTDRGLDTFAKYPQFRLSLLRPKTLPKGYPAMPQDLGEHIRKRRLDLGLLQIEVAQIIGVTESTVWNWEHGTDPELVHIPTVLAFLGYVPWECPEDPIERLRLFKRVQGLSYERLGEVMRRDPEQLSDWLSGRNRPCKRNKAAIEVFLQKMTTGQIMPQ